MHSEVLITVYRKEVSWKETHLIQAKNSTAEFLGKKTRVWRKKIFSQKKKKWFSFSVDIMGFLNACVSLLVIRKAAWDIIMVQHAVRDWFLKGEQKSRKRGHGWEGWYHPALVLCFVGDSVLADRVEKLCTPATLEHWKIKAARNCCKGSSPSGLQQNCGVQIVQDGKHHVTKNQS